MSKNSNERVLLVDDEQAVLDGLSRQHRQKYALVTACGAEAAMQKVIDDGPFAVVVTDYQMPGLNGTQLLARVREHDPDIVRRMLTGQAHSRTDSDAVNRGHIFRFLSKPCDPESFRTGLDAALEQYRLRSAERDLLEQTVRGAVQVLADVLSLANPEAFGKASMICALVRHVGALLRLADGWQYETAAMLSQIGFVAVPDDVLDRAFAGAELSPEQAAVLDRHPSVAGDLLQKIPRLNTVAEIVRHQHGTARSTDRVVTLGARMLAAALAYDELIALGATGAQAMAALRKEPDKYDKGVLAALSSAGSALGEMTTRVVPVTQIRVGMVLQEDVRSRDDNLIVSRGHQVTEGSLRRLRSYAELDRLQKVEFRASIGPN